MAWYILNPRHSSARCKVIGPRSPRAFSQTLDYRAAKEWAGLKKRISWLVPAHRIARDKLDYYDNARMDLSRTRKNIDVTTKFIPEYLRPIRSPSRQSDWGIAQVYY